MNATYHIIQKEVMLCGESSRAVHTIGETVKQTLGVGTLVGRCSPSNPQLKRKGGWHQRPVINRWGFDWIPP